MNDGKKRRSSAELPAHKRFAKSRSRMDLSMRSRTHILCSAGIGAAPQQA